MAEPRRVEPPAPEASGRRPLRFCLLTTFYPPESFGGDAVFVRNLAHELARRGHRVDVVHHPDAFRAVGGRAPRERPVEPPGVTVHALSAGAGALEPLLMHQTGRPVLLARRLRELLAQPWDVVHFHNVSLLGAPELLGWGDAVKLYTTHEAWLVCPTHVLFKYGRRPCEKPSCAACSIVHRRPPQAWRSTGRLARALARVDRFLAPSASIARLHRERGLDLPFEHLPSFVPDRGEPPRRAEPRAGERPLFLFAGRLERLKGPQTLLEVFARLPEADLAVAGAGALEEELRRAAPANVRLLGRLDEPALVEAYRAARAVVVPSLCHEVFPLVALEALREGTPVAVARRGALPELVEQSGAGAIYDDAEGLLAILRRWIAEPGEALRLGERGRATWRARWTAERHLDRYLALVDALLAARAGRRAESGAGA